MANILATIKRLTKVEDWFYVRTDINIGADLCSRGAPLSTFLQSKEYFQGPCFLVNPNHDYDSMSIKTIQLLKNLKQVEEEEKKGLLSLHV